MKLVKCRRLKNISQIWEPIAVVLRSKGCNVVASKVENKFKSLRREYIKTKKHNNLTGRDHKTCEFEDELDVLLGQKHNINPKFTISSVVGEQSCPNSASTSNGISSVVGEQNGSNSNSTSTPSDVLETSLAEPQCDALQDDVDQDAAIEAAMTERVQSSTSRTEHKRKGITAQKLSESNDTMSRIEKKLEDRFVEKRKHQEAILQLYKDEIEEAKKFRKDLLETKRVKNDLSKSLLNKN